MRGPPGPLLPVVTQAVEVRLGRGSGGGGRGVDRAGREQRGARGVRRGGARRYVNAVVGSSCRPC